MKTILIRKPKWYNSAAAAASGVICVSFFLSDQDWFTLTLGLISLATFVYFLKEVILNKPEITLTEEGIELKGQGWNHWNYINSINILVETDSEKQSKQFLIIHLKDRTQLKYEVTDLDKPSGEILALTRNFKNNAVGYET